MKTNRMKYTIFLIAVLNAALTTCKLETDPANDVDPITALVVRVSDGDTIRVVERKPGYESSSAGGQRFGIKVRVWGIDAPELRQGFGRQARDALASRIHKRIVRVKSHGKDRYGRVLGEVYLGQVNVNAWMVEKGYAWAYVRYTNKFASRMLKARKAKVGLWSRPAKAPWAWRRDNRYARN